MKVVRPQDLHFYNRLSLNEQLKPKSLKFSGFTEKYCSGLIERHQKLCKKKRMVILQKKESRHRMT